MEAFIISAIALWVVLLVYMGSYFRKAWNDISKPTKKSKVETQA